MPKNRSISRRRALWLGLAGLGSMGALAKDKAIDLRLEFQELYNSRRDFTVAGEASLKQRAAAKGLMYGAAVRQHTLSSDTKFAVNFVKECGILVPEWELEWNILRPTPDSFDFRKADWLAQFAQQHRMFFRGHTLVWHDALPGWFGELVDSRNAEQILRKHITTVVKHYAGKVHSWDVVNEVIEPADGRSDGLRKWPWLQFLGPDYIEIAFRTAAEADPQALLAYNEYGVDYHSSNDEAKRVAVLKLLERLKSTGTPIHALGIQAHLHASKTRFNPTRLKAFVRDVADLGLKVLITEIDVRDTKLPEEPALRARSVAGVYEDYLSAVLEEPAVIAVLTWGLSDHYTWLAEGIPEPNDKGRVRPLPLDAQMKRKLAWNAIARAFDKAPKR